MCHSSSYYSNRNLNSIEEDYYNDPTGHSPKSSAERYALDLASQGCQRNLRRTETRLRNKKFQHRGVQVKELILVPQLGQVREVQEV